METWEERVDARRVDARHLALACGVCCQQAPCWGEMLLGGEQGCSAALVAASTEHEGFGSAWFCSAWAPHHMPRDVTTVRNHCCPC